MIGVQGLPSGWTVDEHSGSLVRLPSQRSTDAAAIRTLREEVESLKQQVQKLADTVDKLTKG